MLFHCVVWPPELRISALCDNQIGCFTHRVYCTCNFSGISGSCSSSTVGHYNIHDSSKTRRSCVYQCTNNLLKRYRNYYFKLEKGPTDKAKEPDPGGSDQQNLGFKKTEKQKNWPYFYILHSIRVTRNNIYEGGWGDYMGELNDSATT